MRIDFVEVANFRKLRSIHVGFAEDKTVFVGANNSGKTSAMVALRYFLIERERSNFSLNDFTLSHWPTINEMGNTWELAAIAGQPVPEPAWSAIVPSLDVWLRVADEEVHYVQKILPTLDWEGGELGVRLRFEPKDPLGLQKEYLIARAEVRDVQSASEASHKASGTQNDGRAKDAGFKVSLWPLSLTDFLQRRLRSLFDVRAYVLDPEKRQVPKHGVAQPQLVTDGSEPIEGNPFKGLIRIDEISAQRGFGQSDNSRSGGDDDDDGDYGAAGVSGSRKLSVQLRRYYTNHLDPYENPDVQDLVALQAIEAAQGAFDERLREGFAVALREMEQLGYPGVTDPKLDISTRLRPVDGLKHEAAVQYIVRRAAGDGDVDLRLPEASNGLGYQNLISMVFRLMSFRDSWMRVGKARKKVVGAEEQFLPPLHLVLIEEPEAHLHTQVQQVFIRQAYKILRSHPQLGQGLGLSTQLVVSTHSSHIAHECDFGALRYFRRMPAQDRDIPTCCVVTLTNVFGSDEDTKRFVTRYLKVTHCDLFFADAAVLVEGPAERILVPHFLRHDEDLASLSESYITWLEIGGSHAHRLRQLIESLGLTTLIITDIDAVNIDGKSAPPKRGVNQTSRNKTLELWCPCATSMDELLDKKGFEKVKSYDEQLFSACVAYQCPTIMDYKGNVGVEALANTLEDALVFHNMALFGSYEGKGLIGKFRKAIEESSTIGALGQALFDALKAGGKAELALDLLELKDPKSLKAPSYIREGLLWLAGQLRKRGGELGLTAPTISDEVSTREVS